MAGIRLILLVLIFLGNATIAAFADPVLRILLDEEKIYPILNISSTGREGTKTSISVEECPLFDEIAEQGAIRFEIEFAMICNVLGDQGLVEKFEFLPFPTLKRALADLSAGKVDAIGASLFRSATNDSVLVSDATIELGDFKVGVFTTADRLDVQQIETAEQLRALRAITVQHWNVDFETLKGMNLAAVVTARRMPLIPNMIDRRRADFTLSYLDRQTTDHMGMPLVRVDGFRVSYNDERVFVFSPKRADLVQTMNEFIKKNRAAPLDRIRNAFEVSGFIVDKYDSWLDVTIP